MALCENAINRTAAAELCSVLATLRLCTYLIQSQRVSVSWCDGVHRGVEGQPAPAAQVIPTETSKMGWWDAR